MRFADFFGSSAIICLIVTICCLGLTGCGSKENSETTPAQYHKLIVKPVRVVEEKDPLSHLDGQLLTGSPYVYVSDPNPQDTTPVPSYNVDLPK